MAEIPGAPKPLPGDTLPPVEAPNAGFILQLFVIPGVIVVTIFIVVALLRLLAQTPSDPSSYIADLSKGGEARWRAAFNLANLLHDSSQQAVKRDPELAGKLAAVLEAELANNSREQMQENAITLRIYLCRAMGEFQVDRGVDVLLKAATTQRDEAELDVQRAAVAALAVLASNVRDATGRDLSHPKLMETLVALSHDKDDQLRSAAAYALGVVGGPVAIERLEHMVNDEAYPDALYNAATGLARNGNAKCIDVLVEMLDPQQTRGVGAEKEMAARPYKRLLIIMNGLRATATLAEANPTADLSRLQTAIEQLLQGDPDATIKVNAPPVLEQLKRRHTAAATPS